MRKALAAVVAALALLVASVPAHAQPAPGEQQQDAGVKPASSRESFSREEAAMHSSRSQDVRGALPSLYRGIYFHADQESFRLCVGNREGSFVYVVRGGGGDNYYGTYQFHRDFQRGAAYMMASESRETRDGLRDEALELRFKPINRWSRYWQDRAFYTVLNYRGKWTGRHHWNSPGMSC
jgi:hypothetical protein